MNARQDKDRVVVTGIGPLCSLGAGSEGVWRSIENGRLNLVRHTCHLDEDKWGEFCLHKVKGFDVSEFDLPEQNLEFVSSLRGFKRNDTDLHYFLATVKLALDDSGLAYEPSDNTVGLVLTHENPGMEVFVEEIIDGAYAGALSACAKDGTQPTKLEFSKRLYNECEGAGYSLQTFSYLYSVAKVFDMHGFSLFINNACASGLYAIETAANQLRSGLNSAVVVAAIDNPTKIYKHEWFRKKGLYADDGMTRPFSRAESGIVFGDGGAALILETLEHASSRGAHIYAEYLGGGFTLEGWKITVPNVTEDFYGRSFRKALERASVAPVDIDLVNPHGVGMKVTDSYEAQTIRSVFGESKVPVSAFKPLVGHNLGGSALMETALTLLAMEKSMIPATLNCEELDERLGLNVIRRNTPAKLDMVAKMACGFAGFNAVAIFGKLNAKG